MQEKQTARVLRNPNQVDPGKQLKEHHQRREAEQAVDLPGEQPPPGEDTHRVPVLLQNSLLGQTVQIAPGVQGVEVRALLPHGAAQLQRLVQRPALRLQAALPLRQRPVQGLLPLLQRVDLLQREAQLAQQLHP